MLFEKYGRKEGERERVCSAAYILNHDDANGYVFMDLERFGTVVIACEAPSLFAAAFAVGRLCSVCLVE